MNFARIERALDASQNHLDETGRDAEIESYLVGCLLAMIYAQYETIIVRAEVFLLVEP